jgi:hypothetical protein
MNRPDTPCPDPWDQFSDLWDHTDVQLVSDALKIVNSDDAEWKKIGRLQLLVSAWEAKNFSLRHLDERGYLVRPKSREGSRTCQAIPQREQGKVQDVLENLLRVEQRETQGEAQRVRTQEQGCHQPKEQNHLLQTPSSQEERSSGRRRGGSC